ncbi:MAG: VOC family protein [Nodosilinea sp.]
MHRAVQSKIQQLLQIYSSFRNCFQNYFFAILAFIATLTLSLIVTFSDLRLVNAQISTQDVPSVQLHHLTVSVNDVNLVSQWYADYLGFILTDRFMLTRPDGSQIDVARLEIPGLRMNVSKFPGSVPSNRSTENQGWRHIAFEVDDIDRIYQQLQSRGVQFITEPYTYDPPGYRVVFLRDIEENIVELYQE